MVSRAKFTSWANLKYLLAFLIVNSPLLTQDQKPLFDRELDKLFLKKKARFSQESIPKENYILVLTKHVVNGIKVLNPNYELRKDNYFKLLDDDRKRAEALAESLRSNGVSNTTSNKFLSIAKEYEQMIADKVYSVPARKKMLNLLSIGDNINQRASRGEGFADLENELNSYFGGTSPQRSSTPVVSTSESTVADVLSEWELSQLVNFQVSESELLVLQKKLVDRASSSERVTLAKDLFRRGLNQFNLANYSESALILESLLKSYSFIRNKYQIQYFLGLSYFYLSRFDKAESALSAVLNSPKADQVIAFSLLKIYIASKDEGKINQVAQKFNSLSSTRNLSDDFNFVLGRHYLETEAYRKSRSLLQKVSSNYHLSVDAKYYSAVAAYKASPDIAKRELYSLLNGDATTLDIRHEILIKLAYIHFMEKNYSAALTEYRKINAENCYAYERVLLGVAWCYYEIENRKKDKDYTQVITLVNEILRTYADSDSYNEATALIGYVKQKSGNYDSASKDFKHLFDSKAYSLFSDKLLHELDSLKSTKRTIDGLKEKALLKNDRSSFQRLDDLSYSVDKQIFRLTYMDVSSVSPNTNRDLSSVLDQITEFERLKVLAEKKNDADIAKRIDQNLLRLYSVVNKYKEGTSNSLFGINYFKEHKLARKVSINKHQYEKYATLQKESQSQLNTINSRMQELQSERSRAASQKQYRRVVDIDLALARLKTTEGRLDYLNSLASSVEQKKSAANLDKWANYGAYQLTNIQYAQKQSFDQANQKNAETIATITKLMSDRNVYLSEQIKQVENRIYNMTRREARRRRIAERNKKKEFYETEFFDERKSEVNEDSIRQHLEVLEQDRLRARRLAKNPAAEDTVSANGSTQAPGTLPKNNNDAKNEADDAASAATREEN